MAGSADGVFGVEIHQPVERRLGQNAQEIAVISLLDGGQELGSSDAILSLVVCCNATLLRFSDDHPAPWATRTKKSSARLRR